MIVNQKSTHIAYRCPECGTAVIGFVGQFALAANLVRLKCPCGKSSLDAEITREKKIRLSVPCLYCRKNHSFLLSQNIFFGQDLFLLSCPYANMDIAFIGAKESVDKQLEESGEQLAKLIGDLGIDDVHDMQPTDTPEEEVLPDAEAYDTARFLVKELEADGKIDCPCHDGEYDLRYCPEGVEVYCKKCGATYVFRAYSATQIEEFLDANELKLT